MLYVLCDARCHAQISSQLDVCRKMASAKFLEEALNTDVDESAVSAIVGSLENQLVTATSPAPAQTAATVLINQNHINSAISNGGGGTTATAAQKQPNLNSVANGDSISASAAAAAVTANSAAIVVTTSGANSNNNNNNSSGATDAIVKQVTNNNAMIISGATATSYVNQTAVTAVSMASTLLQSRAAQSLPNGTLGLAPPTAVHLQSTANSIQHAKQAPTIVLKTSGTATGAGAAPGLVTVPMNVSSSVAQANNVGSPSTQSPNILSNLQVVNVRPGVVPSQQQKGQPARVVLSAPQLVGARPGAPQLTLQSFHGLQPGQQGALLLKTENGQFQLLRVGPAPATANLANATTPGGQPVTIRMQTVATQPVSNAATSPAQVGGTTTVTSTPVTGQTATVQRPANDNTKEKCRKFLANLLELSSREPKAVERSVRSLIQELIDNKVEPEDFCDKLERLLNASPQPCLIGFLKKSLPLLRQSLATQELTIDGIRPPPANVVFSVAAGTPTVQTIRPGIAAANQVRIGTTTVVRPAPGQVIQQRLVAPIRAPVAPQATRMVTTIRQPAVAAAPAANNVIVSTSQPPALHPVFPNNQQVRAGIRQQQVQVHQMTPGQVRAPVAVRTPTQAASKAQGANKPTVPSAASRPAANKDKEKKSFSSAYTGDDDINDVAAMGGVNLAEETQKILGSTEFVGTKIRSCKEEIMCSIAPLQQKIRQIIISKHGLEEPSGDVAACVSHAAQERLKNLIEKLALITEHRLEIVKSDQRYEVSNDVKGQLKFLEDLDKAERKKHEEIEREMLLRAAKSRSKTEDPEQAKLKAKAKEMQRVEMEELRQREANATALQAIGPRKKPRLDNEGASGASQANAGGIPSGIRSQMPLRQRMKKVTLRDLQFLFETEKDLRKSKLLYKSYLK